MLSPRLQLKVAQKQILTPGLVQMVTILQVPRLELKEMILQEIAENPVLEETSEAGEELTPEEVQAFLEAEERVSDPADKSILETVSGTQGDAEPGVDFSEPGPDYGSLVTAESGLLDGTGAGTATAGEAETIEIKPEKDPFDEIDFGSFFDDYLDPGYKSPASENFEKPSFETFLSSPVTLSDHLHSQLALVALSPEVRDAAETIIGNLNENGYLMLTPEELATSGQHDPADVAEALRVIHTLDPAGVG